MRIHGMWKAIFLVVCLSFVSVMSLQGCPSNVTPDGGESATEQTTEQATEQAAEQATEQVAEQAAEQATEQVAEQATEQAAEQAAETTADGGAEATAEMTADGGAEATPEMTAEATPEAAGQKKFTVRLRSLNPQVPQQTFVGAKICEEDTQNCVNADANSEGALMLDAGKEVYISVEGSSAQQPIFPLRSPIKMTPTDVTVVFYVFLNQEVQGLAGVAGVQVDSSKGMLGVRSLDDMTQAKDGVSFSMAPMSGQGPYYLGLTGLPDATLTKTSQAGTAFFANTTPNAPFIIKGQHDTLTCKGISIAHVDANGDLKIVTKAGTLTTTSVVCK